MILLFFSCLLLAPSKVANANELGAQSSGKISNVASESVSSIRNMIIEQIENVDIGISNRYTEGVDGDFSYNADLEEENMSNYVADSAMNGIIAWISNVYSDFAMGMAKLCLYGFRPSFDTFDNKIGASGVSMFQNFVFIGAVITILLFVFYFCMCFLGTMRLAEFKETPFQLIGRLPFVFGIIYFSNHITQLMFSIGTVMWNFVGSTEDDISYSMTSLGAALVPKALAQVFSFALAPVTLIVTIVMGLIVLYQLLKLWFEVIERYLVACVLAYVFPIPAGCLISKNSSGIFKKYMQMFIIQILMLILNLVFMSIIISMSGRILRVPDMDKFMEYVFLLGMIKVAHKIDNYAFTMGLSVAVTGGNLLDSAAYTAGGMLMMAKGIGGAASSYMMKAGAATNNMDMINKGKKINNIVNPSRPEDMTTAGAMGTAAKTGDLKHFAESIKPEQIDESMINAAMTGMNSPYLNSLSMPAKEELLNRAFGAEEIMKNGGSIEGIYFDKYGGATVTMAKQDSSGTTRKQGIKFATDPGRLKGNVKSLSNMNGDTVYYSSTDDSSQTKVSNVKAGAVLPYEYDPYSKELSDTEITLGKDFSNMGDFRKDIGSVEVMEDGGLQMRDNTEHICAYMDRNGNISYNMSNIHDADGDQCHVWNLDTMSRYEAFQGYTDLKFNDNGNGTVSIIGKNNKGTFEEFTAYNKATYSRDSINGTGTFKGSTKSNNQNAGSYMIVHNDKVKQKDAQKELAYKHSKWEHSATQNKIMNVKIHKKK